MWSRESLKNKAKASLRGTYVSALIVSALMYVASGAWNRSNNGEGARTSSVNVDSTVDFSTDGISGVLDGPSQFIDQIGIPSFVGIVVGFFSFLLIMGIIKLLVGYLIEVGGQKYFLNATRGESSINYLTYGFTSGRWLNIVRTMFLRSVFTILWTMLLIVPGIIKYYSYRMVPYILAENPEIDSFEAIALSQEMTSGEKMNMFVMDLSFIGWFILGSLLFGFGVVFVMPYYNATYAELYYTLKGDNHFIEGEVY